MKKEYTRPTVSFENFAFSSSIAAGCSDMNGMHTEKTNCSLYGTFSSPNSCAFQQNGFKIFYDIGGVCMMSPQESQMGNLCYHVSTDTSRMFMS